MMACARYLESIQELVDGTIGAIRRAELEQHLETCPGCRALLEDLERIRDAAAALPAAPPPDRVWLQVAGRLRQEGRIRDADPVAAPRGQSFRWMAVAASLVLIVGASLLLLYPRFGKAPAAPAPTTASAAKPASPGNSDGAQSVETVQNELESAQAQFETAITHLEQIARTHGQSLDPQTAKTLEKNIAITDQAIAESRAAVRVEPTSVAARETLFDALRQKVSLLQDTISLMNEMRKGNNAGAAQVLNKS